jgi:signal transduction histidine kinase/CheY-like chemotaxis protein/HAMP domain-containing protein
MNTKGLRFKINTAILLASMIVALFAAAVLFPFEKKRRDSRLQRIHILVSAVYQQNKEELANEIFADQILALQNTLQSMQQVTNIAHLAAYHLDGSLLATTGPPFTLDIMGTQQEALRQAPQFLKINHDGRWFAEWGTSIEVIGERVGYLRLLYDLSEMERDSLITNLFFFALLFSALMVMGIFLHLMLSQSVIAPAAKLRDAIRKVSRGRLGEQVRLDRQDEIGEMAADFNRMSTRLQEQHIALTEAMQTQESYAAQLENLNTRLEEMVEQRTAELKNSYQQLELEIKERQRTDQEKKRLQERLMHSQKMEALGLLAGGVAHDLNNVLSGIVSYPDLLLLQLPDDSPLRKSIQTIQRSGKKAAAIVQDLLTLARRGVVHREALHLNKEVIIPYLQSPEYADLIALHPELQIETKLERDLMLINGSLVHLSKTLMNLVSNAVESIVAQGTILIATANTTVDRDNPMQDQLPEGNYVVLTVRDTGSGIAAEDLDRIFEPFYTKKKLGRSGTGLGMAVVWGTVQDHEGHIRVQSREGQGSTFTLYFPATRASLPVASYRMPLSAYRGQGASILVVDDMEDQREITASILDELGYRTHVAASGEAALEFLQNHTVDGIILDMIMEPGMDGLDTFKGIIALHPRQKVIIASGFAENERVKQALALGAVSYIRKPFTMETIGLAVRDALSADKTTSESTDG